MKIFVSGGTGAIGRPMVQEWKFQVGWEGTRYHCLLSTNTSFDRRTVCAAGVSLVCCPKRQHCGHSDNDRPRAK